MKKHYHKRKKVVVDIMDNRIITDDKAIKVSNIELYVEKNGYKLIKMLSVALLLLTLEKLTYAYDASYMTKLDISVLPNVWLLIAVGVISLVFIIFGFLIKNFIFIVLGSLLLLFIGLILLANGFNVVLSIS